MMTERDKLESYVRERMSRYIEFMFNASSDIVQEEVVVLLEDHLGETSVDLWNQSKQAVDMLWDMDERLADIDNKNKE